MAQAIVSDRRDDEAGGAGREVLFLDNDQVIAVDECRQLRCPRAVAEQVVRAEGWDALKEIGQRCEALMLPTFPQQSEFRAMIGEAVDLAVIEFAPTDGLGWRESVLSVCRRRRL